MRRLAASLLLGAAAVCLPACTESRELVGYRHTAPARPRPSPPAPPGARADVVVVNVGAALLDTDGNGYGDLIQTTVYLFDTRHPAPIYQDGTFVFQLYSPGAAVQPGAQPLREWRYVDQSLAGARGRDFFGPCYYFRLSLLEQGGDALGVTMADLACRFEPATGGDPARTRGVATIATNRRVAAAPPAAAPQPQHAPAE